MFRVFRASELEHSNLKGKGGQSLSLRNKTFPFGNSYSAPTAMISGLVVGDTRDDTACDGWRNEFGLNYTLPMSAVCPKKVNGDGEQLQTIPKLIPAAPSTVLASCRADRGGIQDGIPPSHRVCRIPGVSPPRGVCVCGGGGGGVWG